MSYKIACFVLHMQYYKYICPLYQNSVVGFIMKCKQLLLTLQILIVTWSCFTRAEDDESEIDKLRAELVSYQYIELLHKNII